MRYLGICDGNLEEGSMRCDVNVSIRARGEEALGTRTEIKNLNSFKAVETGLEIEIERQRAELAAGGKIERITYYWDAGKKKLIGMRRKEGAHDYRYFPEPDLPVLQVDDGWIEREKEEIPELPLQRERRFREQYGLSGYDAAVLAAESEVADYFEETARLSGEPKASANWVMRDVLREMKGTGRGAFEFPVGPGRLADLIGLVRSGTISTTAAVDVFIAMLETGESAGDTVRRLGLERISGLGELETLVDSVLSASPDEVDRYRAGKKQLMKFFVGQVMKESGGRADPMIVSDILRRKLDS
jgi:aspartyl-tRNA(Asn)/glutamyl-tRNA(Gln) amidotransferase subunit B